jgi:hypothetical protein
MKTFLKVFLYALPTLTLSGASSPSPTPQSLMQPRLVKVRTSASIPQPPRKNMHISKVKTRKTDRRDASAKMVKMKITVKKKKKLRKIIKNCFKMLTRQCQEILNFFRSSIKRQSQLLQGPCCSCFASC